MVLEFPGLPAQRGLGDVQRFRSSPDALVLNNGEEIFEMAELSIVVQVMYLLQQGIPVNPPTAKRLDVEKTFAVVYLCPSNTELYRQKLVTKGTAREKV